MNNGVSHNLTLNIPGMNKRLEQGVHGPLSLRVQEKLPEGENPSFLKELNLEW